MDFLGGGDGVGWDGVGWGRRWGRGRAVEWRWDRVEEAEGSEPSASGSLVKEETFEFLQLTHLSALSFPTNSLWLLPLSQLKLHLGSEIGRKKQQ